MTDIQWMLVLAITIAFFLTLILVLANGIDQVNERVDRLEEEKCWRSRD